MRKTVLFPFIHKNTDSERRAWHKKRSLILLLLFMFMLLSSCAQQAETEQFFCMDTLISITCYGSDASTQIASAKEELERLDALLDAEDPASELSALNRGEDVSEETLSLVNTALSYSEKTDGAFDITLRPASLLWGFSGENEPHIPDESDLAALRAVTGRDQIQNLSDLPEGMSLDLGGIAKGYASDRLADLLRDCGAQSAVISLGGNVRVLGTKPDGTPYTVGIRDPFSDSVAFSVDVADTSVITSGNYQRFFEENGVRYHHILDPETLCPAKSGLVSATVICENGTYADALSTALFVMGREKAETYYRNNGDFEMILIDDQNRVFSTPGVTLTDHSDGVFTYHEIS